eukprot:15364804-Ditylum_brightwellii.AAC.3
MDAQTWFGDSDVGDMFHNHFLDLCLRPYADIDLKILDDDEHSKNKDKRHWHTLAMGLKKCQFFTGGIKSFAQMHWLFVGVKRHPASLGDNQA